MSDTPGNFVNFKHVPTKDNRWIKYLQYFATKNGKTLLLKVNAGVALTIGAGLYLSQTIFIDKLVDVFRAYEYGVPMHTPSWMHDRLDEVVEFLKIPASEAANLESFMLSSLEIRQYGSIFSAYKGWIGIPMNFLYTSKGDVDVPNIRIGGDEVDWSTEVTEQLVSSLVLTENEQKFALVRAVLQLKNYDHMHGSLAPVGILAGLYATARYVNRRFNLLAKSPFLRGNVYFGLTTGAYALYRLITDAISYQQTSRIDKQLADFGPDMCQAGIDYYSKYRAMNRAYNDLTGGSLFQMNGDERVGILRISPLILTSSKRQLYLKERLQQYQAEQKRPADVHKNEASTVAE